MIIKSDSIPDIVEPGSTLELTTNNTGYFTHGFFKYPCKFIPQIPNWAILKYSKDGDFVLDPFAGSGTSMVEAILHLRNGLAVDFDSLSQLLCKTKTKLLSLSQIKILRSIQSSLISPASSFIDFTLDLHNTSHWFSSKNFKDLINLKSNIENFHTITQDHDIYNFLLVCFASIIKKCSFADDVSPKPYVSTRILKIPQDVNEYFKKIFNANISVLEQNINRPVGYCSIISDDARDINNQNINGEITLAVTSPPYINAFDYVRSLRLENAWLGFYGDSNIIAVKRKQIGTESIPSSVYSNEIPKSGFPSLDLIIDQIKVLDRKRSFVVWQYFSDMQANFRSVFNLLKKDGHFVVVVGDSLIRNIEVPTHEIFQYIANNNGFTLVNQFSYIIKNRYIRIPRSGQGGFIDKDWVLVFKK